MNHYSLYTLPVTGNKESTLSCIISSNSALQWRASTFSTTCKKHTTSIKSLKLWIIPVKHTNTTYVNIWGRLRESWGRFIGESIRFLRVIDGLLAPDPNTGLPAAGLLLSASSGTADCLAGEQPEMSKGPEFELFCLACGHMSSLGPGVSGVKTDQSATNKSTGISSQNTTTTK